MLLVEQNFAMAKALGDRVAVMDDGRVVHRGAMAELAADEALQQRLLGLSLGGAPVTRATTPMTTAAAAPPRRAAAEAIPKTPLRLACRWC